MRRTDENIERLTAEISKLAKSVAELKGENEYMNERRTLQDSIHELKEQLVDLEISKAQVTEEHEKEKREVKHMVGLERKRQEWEHQKAMESVENARREAVIEVKEKNLASEREAFEKQMKFITERFTSEIEAQRKMLSRLIPNIDIALGNKSEAS